MELCLRLLLFPRRLSFTAVAPTCPVGKQSWNRCSNRDKFYVHLTDCGMCGQRNMNDFWFVIYFLVQGDV